MSKIIFKDVNGFKLKVGQRVVAVAPCDGDGAYIGLEGKINDLENNVDGCDVLVSFTEDSSSEGWWCEPNSLRVLGSIPENPVIALEWLAKQLQKNGKKDR